MVVQASIAAEIKARQNRPGFNPWGKPRNSCQRLGSSQGVVVYLSDMAETTTAYGGFAHFLKAFVTGAGKDALSKLIVDDIQKLQSLTSLQWAPAVMKKILQAQR